MQDLLVGIFDQQKEERVIGKCKDAQERECRNPARRSQNKTKKRVRSRGNKEYRYGCSGQRRHGYYADQQETGKQKAVRAPVKIAEDIFDLCFFVSGKLQMDIEDAAM